MFFERLLLPVFCLGIKALPWALAEEVELREVAADKGTNVTLPCRGLVALSASNVQWVHRGNHTHHEILLDGSLFIPLIGVDDAGLYECGVENETSFLDRINLTVRTEPPPLVNVTVHASTILALILWNVAGDGGHPIIDFTAEYRSAAPVNGSLEPWRPISPNHISPNSRQVDVYHLEPNASYWFRVWATNALGSGPPVEVLATTLFSDQEAELYKHFLEGSETFDTRTWVAAVCVVMGTLLVLAIGTCAVLCREWRRVGGVGRNTTRNWRDFFLVTLQNTGLSRRVWSWWRTSFSTPASWMMAVYRPRLTTLRAPSSQRPARRSLAVVTLNRAASDSQLTYTAGYSTAPTLTCSRDPSPDMPSFDGATTYSDPTCNKRPNPLPYDTAVYYTI